MADRSYSNYLPADDHDRVGQAYGPNHERLVELKRRYDPDNLFRLNHNIDPKGDAGRGLAPALRVKRSWQRHPARGATRCSARRSTCAGARSARTSA